MTSGAEVGWAARSLLRLARSGSLATLEAATGHPFASFVTVACDLDGSPIFLLSDLSDHTRNLKADPRVSLLVEAASHRANPQTGPRLSLVGRMERRERGDDDRLRRRFLARHPGARPYADFTDFAIYRMAVARAHYVGGFARAHPLDRNDLLLEEGLSTAFAAEEAGLLSLLAGQERDLIGAALRARVKASDDAWAVVGVDPDGCDVRSRRALIRLDLPLPAGNAKEFLTALAALGA